MAAVIRSFTCSRWNEPARNEDRVAIAEPFFAVLDGGTAKHAHAEDSPGQRAAKAMEAGLLQLSPLATAREAVDALTARVAALQHVDSYSAFGSALIYSAVHREVWVVGDGWVMLNEQVRGFGHEIESRAAAARAALLRARLQTATLESLRAQDVGRDMILPLLRAESDLANLELPDPLCFGRIDGRPVPERFLNRMQVPRATKRLVLASDGYPQLLESYAATENALQERIRSDPLMINDPPMTKGVAGGQISYDDRAWLELDVTC